MNEWSGVRWDQKPLIGMVHLAALPGSPGEISPGMDEVLSRALADARALERGGADAVIVENFFDAPFPRAESPPHTVAAMARAVSTVVNAVRLPVGVNMLRNDAAAAIAVAHICGARFVRINVYVGAAVTDQGIIQGAAREAVRYRRELGARVGIWADIFVKHAAQLGGGQIEDAARDAALRGKADVLIVSGPATGDATDISDVERAKLSAPGVPVVVGSGMNVDTAAALMRVADGAIVGTYLKEDGKLSAPVDEERVRRLRGAMK